ncbi:sensor histidine kinase [Aliikangiella coralliicola]|uniref:Sensor histidine kinase n=1 Tax=Aliikangiella coralliicola TaxID=2592383 RepID=A0A545UJ17_9GAMM|nr:histidine kinase [Aliikangiella coralliicola]TQV89459.1 sensor histidine kinase [Aliikangiella coralliicola]
MFAYYKLTSGQYLFWFVIWSILAVIMAQTEIADSSRGGFSGFAWEPWCWAFSAAYAYALLTPIIVYWCHRWPIESNVIVKTAIRLIFLYFPIALLFITLMLGFRHLTYWVLLDKPYNTGDIVTRYIYEFPKSLSLFFVVVFITYTRIFQRKAQAEQLNVTRLHGQLMESRLESLQNQLNPHFLFNTLNLISSTMYQSVDKADSIISRLGDILRYSLTTQHKTFVTLQEELEAMQSFIEIAELRFGDRFSASFDVADEARNAMIPAMLLQPILENAFKYGIEPADNGGTIVVTASIKQGRLILCILNSVHATNITTESFGIGLNNTRKRLQFLYEGKGELTLTSIDRSRVELKVSIPFERLSDE